MADSHKFIKLSTGALMPSLGLGTWQSSKKDVQTAVQTALNIGYRSIDTAFAYGNEADIGEVLQDYISQGKIKRSELFITTKLAMTFHKRERVTESLKKSLTALKLDYVDLFLIHIPCGAQKSDTTDAPKFSESNTIYADGTDLLDTWRGMEDVFNAGLAKAIGLSNVNTKQIDRIYNAASVKPHNVQNECHLYFQQKSIVELCQKYNISFTSYSPLGSPGRLSYKVISKNWPTPGDSLEDPIVVELSKRFKKTPAQVLLRWGIQRGLAVIPKSVTPVRVEENFQIFDFNLTDADMKALGSVTINQRLFLQDFIAGHPDDPLKEER